MKQTYCLVQTAQKDLSFLSPLHTMYPMSLNASLAIVKCQLSLNHLTNQSDKNTLEHEIQHFYGQYSHHN